MMVQWKCGRCAGGECECGVQPSANEAVRIIGQPGRTIQVTKGHIESGTVRPAARLECRPDFRDTQGGAQPAVGDVLGAWSVWAVSLDRWPTSCRQQPRSSS
jgi:hypothetical protein